MKAISCILGVMRSRAELVSPLLPEDLLIIEFLEAHVETFFREYLEEDEIVMGLRFDPRLRLHHWDEAIRRMRSAGYIVHVAAGRARVERPPLGEGRTIYRLRVGEPATNLVAIAQLIGRDPVEAAFDAYLDDVGLERFTTLHRFGVTFSTRLRLLTSPKGARALSGAFARDVFREVRSDSGEIRVTPAHGHEGRYLLLGGGRVLDPGVSWNCMAANDRAIRDSDRGDRVDFEDRWRRAGQLGR
jgi:hypothetical protein